MELKKLYKEKDGVKKNCVRRRMELKKLCKEKDGVKKTV